MSKIDDLNFIGKLVVNVTVKYRDENNKRQYDTKTVCVNEFKEFQNILEGITKLEATETELAELKKNVIEIANEVDKKQVNWLSVAVCFQELRELCEVKE